MESKAWTSIHARPGDPRICPSWQILEDTAQRWQRVQVGTLHVEHEQAKRGAVIREK